MAVTTRVVSSLFFRFAAKAAVISRRERVVPSCSREPMALYRERMISRA